MNPLTMLLFVTKWCVDFSEVNLFFLLFILLPVNIQDKTKETSEQTTNPITRQNKRCRTLQSHNMTITYNIRGRGTHTVQYLTIKLFVIIIIFITVSDLYTWNQGYKIFSYWAAQY